MDENHIAALVIGAAIEVHRQIGPGLLESVYGRALAHELGLQDISFVRELPVGLRYEDPYTESAYRLDFFGSGKVVVELKVIEKLRDEHRAQLLTYLRWSDCRLGLLLNFCAPQMRQGISRVVNHL